MKRVPPLRNGRRAVCIFFALLLTFSPAASVIGRAQSPVVEIGSQSETTPSGFRLERTPVAGGAELLTIFGSLDGLHRGDDAASAAQDEVPLVSVLRDTMGDSDPENDRLRYVWMLTYTAPSLTQRMAAAVPFLYNRAGNKKRAAKGDPPPIIDLASTGKDVWKKIFWAALQNLLLDSYGFPLKASTRAYRRNIGDYRKAHIVRALAILSLYEAGTNAPPAFNATELRDIQARLMLTETALGGILDDINLQRVYQKQTTETRDVRGHNWELLRQQAEAQSLYFEPLELPDGSATHAILWVARPDLASNRERPFKARFLNIANPWRDDRLRYWKGYTETRYFDAENRPVEPTAEGARPVQMIPLALYGLDHPKIPILLVDFRDTLNPKGREMSRRVLQDVTSTVLGLSRFGDLPFFLSRTIYDWVTGRRGIDINQPSRLRSYSQLKLLLSLDASLDPRLRDEISRRLERVSLNPLENDFQAEAQLARDQYSALVAYARRPDGLPARLDRERRAEMTPLKHGRTEQGFLRLANVLSLGLYTHREKSTPELQARLETRRRVAYHERFLREVARSSPRVEVVWNIEDVRRSLRFIEEHGEEASGKGATAAARIFAQTEDEETRRLSLSCLYRINNETAKNELLRIYRDPQLDAAWREMSADYLRRAVREEQRISRADAKLILSMVGQ
ncbi:MAG: hypothetical protein WCF57_15610 [Pyrinomonadaceae bacterium]